MEEFALLRVRLTPRGGRNALMRYEDGVLYARVTAPPVGGAANKALLALLADALDIPKSRIAFHSGETSREKVLRLEGLDTAALEVRLTKVITE